jgi:hypothetical protein
VLGWLIVDLSICLQSLFSPICHGSLRPLWREAGVGKADAMSASTLPRLSAASPGPTPGAPARAQVDRLGLFSPTGCQEVEKDYSEQGGGHFPSLAGQCQLSWKEIIVVAQIRAVMTFLRFWELFAIDFCRSDQTFSISSSNKE